MLPLLGAEIPAQPEGGVSSPKSVKQLVCRSSRQSLAGTPRLSADQKVQWLANARRATQELRRIRSGVHRSTFAALNVDGLSKGTPAQSLTVGADDIISKPLKQQQICGPDSEAETSSDISAKDAGEVSIYGLSTAGRCVSLGLESMASVTGDEAPALSEGDEMSQQEMTPAREEKSAEESAGEAAPSLELGDFFKSPKARSWVRKASKASSVASSSEFSEAPAELATEERELHSLPEESAHHPSAEPADSNVVELPALPIAEMRAFLLSHRTLAKATPKSLLGLGLQGAPQQASHAGLSLRRAGRQLSERTPMGEKTPVPERSPMAERSSMMRQTTAPVADPFCMARQVSLPASDPFGFALARQTSAPVPSSFERLRPSPKAYRVSFGGKSRTDELRRAIKGQLNKVCPESVDTIALRISEVEVRSAEELQEVISLVFQKALSEPHYCATYADLVFQIKSAFPEFPCPEGGKPQTFKTLLLDVCQKEFESLPTSLEPSSEDLEQFDAEELECRRKKTKDRLLANMKLIGHLFLRQMLSPRVIGAVIEELTLCHSETADRLPAGHCVECAVELLLSIGHTLEALPVGKTAIASVCGRLLDLKHRNDADGRRVYCKRIQFAIQDLLDVRAAGWAKKVFSGVAKTKEEIRMEQQRDLRAQASGKEVAGGQVIISGQRPGYIEAAQHS